ncbi:transposase [Streptomyces flavidovirens]|uniref:transposase n=1 Tax=Streptomyces flavidovirens TaxID=67298 RepID=UPI0034199289
MGNRPWIVEDELWALIEPLLPPWPRKVPGPKPVDDRLCLQGVLYVLYHDISWQLPPLEPGASGRPTGADWAGGTRPPSSTSCTAFCSLNCMRQASWTGRGPAWMPLTSARKKGRGHQPVAGRPRERPGRPRKRPDAVLCDKGIRQQPNRREPRRRWIPAGDLAQEPRTSRTSASSAMSLSRPSRSCTTSSDRLSGPGAQVMGEPSRSSGPT